jgi:hypothetical protein
VLFERNKKNVHQGEKQQADPPNWPLDRVVEPQARDREVEVKEDKTFDVEVGVTFCQGSGHDDQGQGVFEYLSFSLFLP